MHFALGSLLMLLLLYLVVVFLGELRDKYLLTKVFSEFVPPQLVDQYMVNNSAMTFDNEERAITVLFADVHGFTTVSERLSAKVLAGWLDAYFDAVSEVIAEHGGMVDKFMGDSVMAVWGAPLNEPEHAERALQAALALQQRMQHLNQHFRANHLPEMTVGIGLCSGKCHVGLMGSRYRRTFTVVGDTVNIAQRLEKMTREYTVPIIVSGSTANASNGGWLFRELGSVLVKGRKNEVGLLQPMGLQDRCSEQQRTWVRWHNRAVSLQRYGQFFEACALFEKLRDETGEIALYQLLLQRLDKAKAQGINDVSL